MTITMMALVICVLLLGIACAYIYTLRKQDGGYQLVTEYQIEVAEKNGFRVVHARILNDHQRTFQFEFVPMFAHQFSDEMLTAVAHAGKPRSVDTSDTKGV